MAIAARPDSVHRGYILGGLCWFAVPFSFATALGLANVALQLPTTKEEAAAGLVPAATAVHLFGSKGAYLIAVMLYMAVTSAGSAELISVSSLFTYDIYRTYVNPQATGHTLMRVSRSSILFSG